MVMEDGQRKKSRKTGIKFDEEARREYLSGFRKRKRQRKKVAVANKVSRQKELQKKLKAEKREILKKKLQSYGLDEELQCEVTMKETIKKESESSSKTYQHHPGHIVIVDTNPHLGESLSTLINDD